MKPFLSLILALGFFLTGPSFAQVNFVEELEEKVDTSSFRPFRGAYECVAVDRGFEEHWGGHSSCSSCLRKHDKCVKKCYEVYYISRAEGIDEYGNKVEHVEAGFSRYKAENLALQGCQAKANHCKVTDTQRRKELASTRRC